MSQEAAHPSLEKEVSRFETMLNITHYIDGDPAMEKAETAAERQRITAHRDAITDVERKIQDCFCDRIKLKDADDDVNGTDKSRERERFGS
jgi:hypothetical protein